MPVRPRACASPPWAAGPGDARRRRRSSRRRRPGQPTFRAGGDRGDHRRHHPRPRRPVRRRPHQGRLHGARGRRAADASRRSRWCTAAAPSPCCAAPEPRAGARGHRAADGPPAGAERRRPRRLHLRRRRPLRARVHAARPAHHRGPGAEPAARRRPGGDAVERAVEHRDRPHLRPQAGRRVGVEDPRQRPDRARRSSATSRPRRARSTCATAPRWPSTPPTACSPISSRCRTSARCCSTSAAGYDFDPFAEGRNSRDRIRAAASPTRSRFLYQDQQDNPYFQLRHGHRRHRPLRLHARADPRRQPRQRQHLLGRSARPAGRDRRRPVPRPERVAHLPPEDAEHAAADGRGDRRLRGGQRQRLPGRVQADRRRDQRLLHPRLHLVEPRPAAARAPSSR